MKPAEKTDRIIHYMFTGIDILSFLFGAQFGLHDVLSKTVVVNSNMELKAL